MLSEIDLQYVGILVLAFAIYYLLGLFSVGIFYLAVLDTVPTLLDYFWQSLIIGINIAVIKEAHNV